MRITFANQLALAESGWENSIRYKHPFRVDVDIYICQDGEKENGWDLHYVSQKQGKVPDPIRAALAREFQIYIRMRLKKSARALSFNDFVEMANAVNIA